MAVDVRSQACSYLRAGKVTVFAATGRDDNDRPLAVRAHMQGQSGRYFVRRNYDGRWLCSCETGEADCPHVAAVQLVTGHDGPASRTGESR
ncbi:hypothetical protein SAMN05421811_103258 [Nonomuraea wenchangensis]|uniref:SWIM-type domain-containing protein n=1 Tax=Nonomuraea wenchangensis TaxID=568860 RepID=A0A1I0EZE9_9ACTN|nr:hypothetical protein SAMN05421811_103258 [Nonomuraea wenchangensis]